MKLVEDKRQDDALKAAYNTDEFDTTFQNYLKEAFGNTIDSDDLTVVGILEKWYDAFHTINNPMFDYIATVHNKLNTQQLSYADLIIFNNAYAKRQITNNDIMINKADEGILQLLTNPNYYQGDNDTKPYWIEIFQFLSSQKNIDTIFQGLVKKKDGVSPLDLGITVAGSTHNISYWKNLYNLRNAVIYGKATPGGELRSGADIEQSLRDLADIPGRVGRFEDTEDRRQDTNKTLKDKESIEKWIKNNKINKETLATLKDYLNGVL